MGEGAKLRVISIWRVRNEERNSEERGGVAKTEGKAGQQNRTESTARKHNIHIVACSKKRPKME